MITAGPYAESREFVGGTIVIDVPTIEEALAWAARSPGVRGGGRVEVRPLLEDTMVEPDTVPTTGTVSDSGTAAEDAR